MQGYFIISSFSEQTLARFPEYPEILFTPTPAITPELLRIGKEMVFDTARFEALNGRKITKAEICHTLSHIACWKEINNNENIADDDFVIIAEDDIEFIEQALPEFKKYMANTVIDYDLILLQRSDNEPYWKDKLYQVGTPFSGFIFHQPESYDNVGAGLYAIRKSKIAEILNTLSSQKPFWAADQFSRFCDYKRIMQINQFIGTTEKVRIEKYRNDNIKFSIIMPIYNTEKYLKEAINSVLKQDYVNYELLLIDDGSTDNSTEICYQYAQKYPHIVFVKKPNSGLSNSRNLAMNIARGDYLLFLDSDDFWRDTFVLSDLHNIVSQHHCDAVFSFLSSYYPDGKIVSHKLSLEGLSGNYYQDFPELVKRKIYQGFAWIKIVKRQLILEHQIYYPPKLNYEDVLWSIKLAKHIQHYAFYASDSYQYRRDVEGSITRFVTAKNISDMLEIFNLSCIEIDEIQFEKPEIYQALELFLFDFSNYIKTCYGLLHNKADLEQAYIAFTEKVEQRYAK